MTHDIVQCFFIAEAPHLHGFLAVKAVQVLSLIVQKCIHVHAY